MFSVESLWVKTQWLQLQIHPWTSPKMHLRLWGIPAAPD